MVVGIKQSKSDEWLASSNVGKARPVRDQRDTWYNGQRTYWGDVEKLMCAGAGKKILIDEIQKVIAAKRHSKQIPFLQVLWEQLCKIQRGDGENAAVAARNNHC